MKDKGQLRRFGQLIRVKPERVEYYKELHANPWECVLEVLKESNVQNYSIFITPDNQLFAYFEYTGVDLESDMKKIASSECTQRWWKETDPCQESLSSNTEEWWLNLEEVFHMD